MHHPIDADTFALWRLDGPEFITAPNQQRDACGTYHFSFIAGAEISPPSLCLDNGASSGINARYRCLTDAALVTMLKASAGWTVEMFFNNNTPVTDLGDRLLFCIGTATSTHFSEDENDLFLISTDSNFTLKTSVPGSSSNVWQTATFGAFPTVPGIHHLAVSWNPIDGTSAAVKGYIDGVQSGSTVTLGRLTSVAAGTNSLIQLRGYPANDYRPLEIIVDDIRLSSRVRSDAEILASYQNGLSGETNRSRRFMHGFTLSDGIEL